MTLNTWSVSLRIAQQLETLTRDLCVRIFELVGAASGRSVRIHLRNLKTRDVERGIEPTEGFLRCSDQSTRSVSRDERRVDRRAAHQPSRELADDRVPSPTALAGSRWWVHDHGLDRWRYFGNQFRSRVFRCLGARSGFHRLRDARCMVRLSDAASQFLESLLDLQHDDRANGSERKCANLIFESSNRIGQQRLSRPFRHSRTVHRQASISVTSQLYSSEFFCAQLGRDGADSAVMELLTRLLDEPGLTTSSSASGGHGSLMGPTKAARASGGAP
jgi:hypothetical protein